MRASCPQPQRNPRYEDGWHIYVGVAVRPLLDLQRQRNSTPCDPKRQRQSVRYIWWERTQFEQQRLDAYVLGEWYVYDQLFAQVVPRSVYKPKLEGDAEMTYLVIHIRICPLVRALSFIPWFDRLLRVFRYSQIKAMYASSKDHTVSLAVLPDSERK